MKRPITFLLILLSVAVLFLYFNVSGYLSQLSPEPGEREEKVEKTPEMPVKNTFLGLSWQEEGATLGEGALRVTIAGPYSRANFKQSSFTGKQWRAEFKGAGGVELQRLNFRQAANNKYFGEGWADQSRIGGRYDVEAVTASGLYSSTWGYFKFVGSDVYVVVFSSDGAGYKMFVSDPKPLALVFPPQ